MCCLAGHGHGAQCIVTGGSSVHTAAAEQEFDPATPCTRITSGTPGRGSSRGAAFNIIRYCVRLGADARCRLHALLCMPDPAGKLPAGAGRESHGNRKRTVSAWAGSAGVCASSGLRRGPILMRRHAGGCQHQPPA